METLLRIFQKQYAQQADPEYAFRMKKYLRNQFDLFGITSPKRKEINKKILKEHPLPGVDSCLQMVDQLWLLPEREFQMLGIEILDKVIGHADSSFVMQLEKLITTKSWWDSVDGLAVWIAGSFFKKYPELIEETNKRWLKSDNFWLQRTTLLFQLKYKNKTNEGLLYKNIESLKYSNEFFVKKAIGWALREYSKTNSESVIEFANKTDLKNLSRVEALKYLNRKR